MSNRGKAAASAVNASCASSRASGAPRQVWMPWPNVVCRFGQRVMSTASGSANRAGSWLAACWTSSTRSPAAISWPRITSGSLAHRAIARIGPS